MAETAVLAAGFTFTVDGIPIGGIDSFTLSGDFKEADCTTFEDIGFERSLITRRSFKIKLTGKWLESTLGAQDPGQAQCTLLSSYVGTQGVGTFVITSTNSGYVLTINGTCNIDEIGGGNDDATKWGCTITRVGAAL